MVGDKQVKEEQDAFTAKVFPLWPSSEVVFQTPTQDILFLEGDVA